MKYRLLTAILFICALLPYYYNAILYSLNYFAYGLNLGIINYTIQGSKDALILVIAFLLILEKSIFFFILILILVIINQDIGFIKEVVEPFLVLNVLYLYRNDISKIIKSNKKIIIKYVNIALFFVAIFSISEYLYRYYIGLNEGNYLQFKYMIVNNIYKCSKYIFEAKDIVEECNRSDLNFYKIGTEFYGYKIYQTLFMPAGDSVSLSFLLLSGMYFILTNYLVRTINVKYISIIALLGLYTLILLTFNRVNSITAGLLLLLFINKINCTTKVKFLYASYILYLLYLGQEYFIDSIFDFSTPSNIGHIDAILNLLNIKDGFDLINLFYVSTLAFIFLIIGWHIAKKIHSFKIRLLIIYTILMTISASIIININFAIGRVPNESNYFKILANYGFYGAIVYNYILAFLIASVSFKSSNNLQFLGKLMVINLISYQLISPYVISGYVVFYPLLLQFFYLNYMDNWKFCERHTIKKYKYL